MHGVAKLGPFRHLDPDLALAVAVFSTQEARRLDLAAQGGGGHRDGNLAEQIEPVALEKLMRFDREEDVEIAARAAAGARGGPRGDLYIFLSVKPHELFERDGLDLLCKVTVPMTTAALGGEIEAPCLLGGENCDGQCKIRVKVPEGAQFGDTVHLRGRGMPSLRSRERGDMAVS